MRYIGRGAGVETRICRVCLEKFVDVHGLEEAN